MKTGFIWILNSVFMHMRVSLNNFSYKRYDIESQGN